MQPGDDRSVGRRPPNVAQRLREGRTGWWLLVLAGLLVVNYWAGSVAMQEEPQPQVPYSPFFLDQVRAGNVAEITSKGTAIQGTFAQPVGYDGADPTTGFKTEIPSFADTAALSRLLARQDVVENARPLDTGTSWWVSLLVGFGPALLLVGLVVWLGRRAGSARSALGSFGRSSARRYVPSGGRATFAEVAGVDEAKQELTEIVDFLRNPDRYARLGGRIPHGVLLSGPPGTGKTLLARALAGEANVPFFSMAASEFVEAIVGVGASRVRDLFEQAQAEAPAIVFIDELDAVGRARTSGAPGFGGNDEREQTLNQILTEMDGFDSATKVIVVGATNRPEVLDPALLRPGRFDRRVTVQPPDRTGRRQILEVHTRGVPLAPDVDLDAIATSTPGMVGADLANLANEAALLAARGERSDVTAANFAEALDKIVLGAERKVLMSADDRRRTAYHEGGHALVGMLTGGADPVRKISIIPRGRSLGVTFAAPDADRYNLSDRELRARIGVALGGRTAEQIVFGDVTTGAESDIEQLTQIARHMVGRWGMNRTVGPLAVLPPDGLPAVDGFSAETKARVDDEVRALVVAAQHDVTKLLTEHRAKLDGLAAALLEHETLDHDQAYAAAGVGPLHPQEVPLVPPRPAARAMSLP